MLGSRARATGAVDRPTRHAPLQRDGSVKIDSKTYPVYDINEQGFVIEHYEGDAIAKQRIYFDLIIVLGEREESFRCDGVVVRNANKTLICKFLDMRRDALRALQQLVASRSHKAPAPQPPVRR